jgi:hypothetical protein
MRSIIARVRGFEYIAEIKPIAAPAGCFSLAVYSTWDQGKAPATERRVAQLNLTAEGLGALRELVDASLGSEG